MRHEFYQYAEQYLTEITLEYYLNSSGHKKKTELKPIYARFGWLFDRSRVDEALSQVDGPASRYIASFIVDGYLNKAVDSLDEQITNETTLATVEWDGKDIPYRSMPLAIRNEPDANNRHELERRFHDATRQHNPLRRQRIMKLHAKAAELDPGGYTALYDRLKNLRLEWTSSQMDTLLEATEDIYRSELQYYLDSIGVSPADATPADAAFILRAPHFDSLFPVDDLVPAFKRTMIGLGIDLMLQDNLHLDVESRPLKSPRAFCSAVQVPQDVRLVMMPRGGQDDYKAFFHEGGHAEHMAFVREDLEFPYRRLGDDAIGESFAFLFEYLLNNPNWWSRIMGRSDIDDYLRLARFYKLWMVRRFAGKLKYERLLHSSSDPETVMESYGTILTEVTGLSFNPVNYLAELDDAFYTVHYIHALIFEVQLRRYLEHYYDKSWFASLRAGGFLTEMWREGQTFSIDEMADQIDNKLDVRPLISEFAVS